VPGFLPDVMPPGFGRALVGVLLAFHIGVAYLITAQPLHRFLHSVLFPRSVDSTTSSARVHWALISVGYLLVGFVLTNVVPFFADVQALIGSLTGAPIVYGWPAFFYVRACRLHFAPLTLRSVDGALCAWYLLVCTPVLTVLGTVGSLRDIAEDVRSSASVPAFTCASDHAVMAALNVSLPRTE